MSGGFSNPLVGGGGSLAYPSIHSPNFVHGSTGWSINKDGSAEFNNIVIRNGEVISGVFLLYSSATPALGNLVVAFAPIAGGTDAVGNIYPQGFNWGVWSASTGALLNHFGVSVGGNTFLASNSGVTVSLGKSADGAQIYYNSSGLALNNMVMSIAPAAGTDPSGNAYLAGTTIYGGAGANWTAMQLISSAGTASINFYNATSEAGPWSLVSSYAGDNAGDLTLTAASGSLLKLIMGNASNGAQVTLNNAGSGQVLVAPVGNSPLTTEVMEVQGTIATELITAIIGGVEETWHNIPLATTWANLGSSHTTPQYRMLPNGEVQVKGGIIFTSTGVGLSGSNPFSTALPAAYRPVNTQHVFAAVIGGSDAPVVATDCWVEILATGVMVLHGVTSTGTATHTVQFVMGGSYDPAT